MLIRSLCSTTQVVDAMLHQLTLITSLNTVFTSFHYYSEFLLWDLQQKPFPLKLSVILVKFDGHAIYLALNEIQKSEQFIRHIRKFKSKTNSKSINTVWKLEKNKRNFNYLEQNSIEYIDLIKTQPKSKLYCVICLKHFFLLKQYLKKFCFRIFRGRF